MLYKINWCLHPTNYLNKESEIYYIYYDLDWDKLTRIKIQYKDHNVLITRSWIML